ncbi:MAG: winged helix-turn-helix domain-containing protein [Thermomicrobiales bacterium]
MLRELALWRGQVFTRQQLLDVVWEPTSSVDERTIDVHMSWLRSKLREARSGRNDSDCYGRGYLAEVAS